MVCTPSAKSPHRTHQDQAVLAATARIAIGEPLARHVDAANLSRTPIDGTRKTTNFDSLDVQLV